MEQNNESGWREDEISIDVDKDIQSDAGEPPVVDEPEQPMEGWPAEGDHFERQSNSDHEQQSDVSAENIEEPISPEKQINAVQPVVSPYPEHQEELKSVDIQPVPACCSQGHGRERVHRDKLGPSADEAFGFMFIDETEEPPGCMICHKEPRDYFWVCEMLAFQVKIEAVSDFTLTCPDTGMICENCHTGTTGLTLINPVSEFAEPERAAALFPDPTNQLAQTLSPPSELASPGKVS